jgi:conjugative relaxase-like TrwC/TraI family protein
MLSIPNPGKGGNGSYYFKYYATECEEPGEWFGDGAAYFGLKGEVDRRTFQYLLDGRSPDGKDKLAKNAGYHSRVSHWDLTFSAPKPVSVLYAFGSESVRKDIIEAHKTAVKFALGYIEEVAGISRQGKGGNALPTCRFKATNHSSMKNGWRPCPADCWRSKTRLT